MRCGNSYFKAYELAKANAELTGVPWCIFSYNGDWHCERYDGNPKLAMTQGDKTVVKP